MFWTGHNTVFQIHNKRPALAIKLSKLLLELPPSDIPAHCAFEPTSFPSRPFGLELEMVYDSSMLANNVRTPNNTAALTANFDEGMPWLRRRPDLKKSTSVFELEVPQTQLRRGMRLQAKFTVPKDGCRLRAKFA